MKRYSPFLNVLLLVLMALQGTSLAAACFMPCRMNGVEKLHCVAASVFEHVDDLARERHGAIQAVSTLCGTLAWNSPAPALRAEKVVLAKAPLGRLVSVCASAIPALEVESAGLHSARAGPPESRPSPALLAVPPQNAPPVLV